MEITGRDKSISYKKQNKSVVEQPIDIELNLYLLDLMCKLVLSSNRLVRRTQLTNLRLFINIINPNNYINDSKKTERIRFIRKGIEARVDKNLTDKYMIMSHINGGILDKTVIDIDDYKDLSNPEVEWITNMISQSLKYSHIFSYVDTMMDACVKFKTAEPGMKDQAVQEFENTIATVQNGLRKRRNESAADSIFSLREGIFEDAIYETWNTLANPKRKLITGMQGLNEMLGGGFEATRTYIFFGLPGEGKSTMLLNLAYQIKKYNVGYKTKDPTKRPCVVLLTMENLTIESIERIFAVSTGKSTMLDYTPEEVIELMRGKGGLRLTDDSPIDIIIKFIPSNSVDTGYLYSFCEDLEDDGLECICMIQDYIGRIRSTERYSDTRLEYGAVVDEFKKFAEAKEISVISASQLNRDASKHIDEAKQRNKTDLVRLLGRSNVSESMLILNNSDGSFMLAPEYSQDGKKYIGVQDVKHRYQTKGMLFMYLPFGENNMQLLEDYYGLPLYKTTMREEVEMNTGPKFSPYHTNTQLNPATNPDKMMFNTKLYSQNSTASIQNTISLINPITPSKRLINPIVFD